MNVESVNSASKVVVFSVLHKWRPTHCYISKFESKEKITQ